MRRGAIATHIAVLAFACHVTSQERPHRFELGAWSSITSQQVETLTAKEIEYIAAAMKRIPEKRELECLQDCSNEPCIFREPRPVNPGLARHSWTIGWADATQNPGYLDAVERWRSLAQTGEIIRRSAVEGEIVVWALSSLDIDQILAKCKVDIVAEQQGAIHDCEPVAVITPEKKWVSVLIGHGTSGNATYGLPDFDLRIVGPATLDVAIVRNAVSDALSIPPLKLAVMSHGDDIVGAAAYRDSPILRDWREIVTVRVDVDGVHEFEIVPGKEVKRPPSGFGLEISTTLYVNRQNTGRETDWHLPSRDQEEMYLDYIRRHLTNSVGKICKSPKWQGDVLFCDVPTTTKLPRGIERKQRF